jgi:hypothetical protein
VLVHDRYPAYLSWDTFTQIQAQMRDNHAEYQRKRTRGTPRDGAALLHGIVYCGQCGHKMIVQYKGGPRYLCNALRAQTGARLCQHLAAGPIDAYAVGAFFEALAPAELDVYTNALAACRARDADVARAHGRELERLRYEVRLARKQYDRVDPDNRLVAAELERRWEAALRALREAEAKAAAPPSPTDEDVAATIPDEVRTAFLSVGQGLPGLWRSRVLTSAQRKALLRCLIDKVVVQRVQRDRVRTRVVWKGGAVSEADVPIAVGATRDLRDFAALEARALACVSAGLSDDQIARQLTEEGFRSAQLGGVRAHTVKAIRVRHRRLHRVRKPCHVEGSLTVPELARAVNLSREWVYDQIRRGTLRATKDPRTNLYLFPDTAQTRERACALRKRLVRPPR